MRRPITIQHDYAQIGTIKDLTSVFEAIASIHISQIKDKVMTSTAFFNELWQTYSQLRTDKNDLEISKVDQHGGRPAVVVVTSEGGLIGDIDDRIVNAMVSGEDLNAADVYVLGAHGGVLMSQRGVKPARVTRLPDIEKGENVRALSQLFGEYSKATVYYQKYISLMRQDVSKIDLYSAVQELGEESKGNSQLISSQSYIFEPSIKEIVKHMESVMLEIALGQVVLESKLAQYASRFNAMYNAKSKAKEMQDDMGLLLSRAKRSAGDERIKEILSAQKALTG